MTQIKKKFIAPNAIDGTKIQLLNGQALRAVDTTGQDRDLFYFNNANEWYLSTSPKISVDPLVANDLVRKLYVDNKVSEEAEERSAADTYLQGQITTNAADIAQEILDRQEGDTYLQGQITTNAADIAQEILDRQAADTYLQGQITTEKGRIDAILSASTADYDSFAEIVSLINSVDTQNDNAFASYVLSNNAALASEIAARQAADAALDVRLDIVEGSETVEGSIAKAKKDAKDYTDAAIFNEEDARMAAIAAVQQELDSTQAGAGLGSGGAYTAPSASSYLQNASSLKDADSKLDSAIAAEASARAAAIAYIEQSISDSSSELAQNLVQAKAYTDTKIAALVDGAPLLLDTLNELAAAIGDDENFAYNVMSSITSETNARIAADEMLQDHIDDEEAARIAADAAEATARQAADAAETAARIAADAAEAAARQAADAAETAARIAADAAEAAAREAATPRFAKVRFTLTATDISNGYVDLAHIVKPLSVNAFIDRLAIHEEDDYTLSTVAGKTRLTFAGVMTGEEGPEAGDLFRIGYAYTNEDQQS